MAHSYVAYVDESGDDGLGRYRVPGARGGSSQWLIISACLFRATHHLEAVKWRDEISALMPEKKSRLIHFVKMNHSQRIVACKTISEKPIRIANIIANKPVIPDGIYTEKNQLYFYLTRYLIERISWLCRDLRPDVPEGDGRVKIIFSRRGNLSYDDFKGYMGRLKNKTDDDVQIHWPVIDINGIEAQSHSASAGLQLADTAASAVAAAFEPDRYDHTEYRYLETIRRSIYHRRGNYFSYGMKFFPKHSSLSLSREQSIAISLFK